MPQLRSELAQLLRPRLAPPGFNDPAFLKAFDAWCEKAGIPRDDAPAGPAGQPLTGAAAVAGKTGPLLNVADLQARIGINDGGGRFGVTSKEALFARLSNTAAPALTEADFQRVADDLGVPVKTVKGVRIIEAPRGAFDDQGRPTNLFERHKFRKHSGGRFDASHPHLSNSKPGGYGPYSVQYDKLAEACALDPEAAFKACSWGAFQVMGENAEPLGYASAFDMVLALVESEVAHLECFVRYVKVNGLVDELRACRPGVPTSCVAFVERYNGPDHAKNNYAPRFAEAIK